MIKIGIVDDNRAIANDIKTMLLRSQKFDVLFMAFSGLNLLELLKDTVPEVLILDIQMPKMSGIEAVKIIKEKYPDIKILMHTISDDDKNIIESMMLGANGYILKSNNSQKFIDAILDVLDGGVPITPSIAHKLITYFNASYNQQKQSPALNQLSEREKEVLQLIAEGMTYKQVADKLCVNIKTVAKHLENTYTKLRVSNKIEAINALKNW